MMRLSIFGATGSIGKTALGLVRSSQIPAQIMALSAYSQPQKLLDLAKEFRPKIVVVKDEADAKNIKDELPHNTKILVGEEGLIEAALVKTDCVLNAIIGTAGLPVSFAALENAARLALANKESLVVAGSLLTQKAKAQNCEILPVDSEHSAIFQSLLGQDRQALRRVILTASGGAFRDWSLADLSKATLAEALKHPNWDMGARITIDSASMFNKALEMIEAQVLFEVSPAQIEVVIHPESIIHSLVEFVDKGQIAQLGVPDMAQAIAFALSFPKRVELDMPSLDLTAHGALHFQKIDDKRFPAIKLARLAMEKGGYYPCVLNTAKDCALDDFMSEKLRFLDMAELVEKLMAAKDWNLQSFNIDGIGNVQEEVRALAKDYSQAMMNNQ